MLRIRISMKIILNSNSLHYYKLIRRPLARGYFGNFGTQSRIPWTPITIFIVQLLFALGSKLICYCKYSILKEVELFQKITCLFSNGKICLMKNNVSNLKCIYFSIQSYTI